MTSRPYSSASDDVSDGNCFCILYYFHCQPQIARVYDTYEEAMSYLTDPKLIDKDNYKLLTGKKYRYREYD